MRIQKIAIAAFFFVVAMALAACACIVIDGTRNTTHSADLAVVFGSKVNEDGSLSTRLQARLDEGLALYQRGQVKKILVSGGLGKEGHWEGEAMQQYLIEQGVPSTDIWVDNYGDNTQKTVINSIALAQRENYASITSVSQYFHQTRIKKLYKDQQFTAVATSSPDYYEMRDGYAIAREFAAYCASFWRQ